jgi:hypothetical protein
MVKRLLDANASDFAAMNARDLVESIRLSEGRVVAAEVVAIAPPLLDGISNAELAAAMGADLILLNLYDVTQPQVTGFASKGESGGWGKFAAGMGITLADVRRLTGRLVGLNLEPIENPDAVTTSGRLATAENARAAVEQGAAFIVATGNPETGVTVQGIVSSVAAMRQALRDRVVIFAGKMHAAGAREQVVSLSDIASFADAGADGLVLPTPGTVPGMTVDVARAMVQAAHARGLLVMNTIGTSQEGASAAVIEQLALWSKMAGADIHHLGDAGYLGIAAPENITAFSIALRGRRHTWRRMAASILR